MVAFDAGASSAFSQAFSNGAHGIYINDRVRFGGCVDPSQVGDLADEIVRQFNDHPESIKHHFRAYRKPGVKNSVAARKFPDIVLDLPDGYQTSSLFPEFVRETKLPTVPFDLHDMKRDPRTVGKAHEPLAVCVGEE
jgi:hypothetical protein